MGLGAYSAPIGVGMFVICSISGTTDGERDATHAALSGRAGDRLGAGRLCAVVQPCRAALAAHDVSLPAAAGQDKLLQLPAGFVNTTQGSAVKATIPHAPIFEVLSRPFTGSAMRNETRGTVVKGGGVKAKHLRDLSAIRAALAEQRRTAEAEAATAARGIR